MKQIQDSLLERYKARQVKKLAIGGWMQQDWTGTKKPMSVEDQQLNGVDVTTNFNTYGTAPVASSTQPTGEFTDGFGDSMTVGEEGSGLTTKQGSSLMSGIVNVGTGAIMAANKKNNNPNSKYTNAGYYKTQTAASGASTGASLGASFGPIGIAAGAVIGGVAGYAVGAKKDKQAARDFSADQAEFRKMRSIEREGRSAQQGLYGPGTASQYYRNGGKLQNKDYPVTAVDASTARGTGSYPVFDNGKQATGNQTGSFKTDPVKKAELLKKKGYKGKNPAEVIQAKKTRDSLFDVVDNIDSRKSDFVRNALPLPENASQMIAKMTGDARLSNNSLNSEEKLTMYDMLQKAKKRTGKERGGTEYEDYANERNTKEDFNNWFNRGKNSVGAIIGNSGSKQNTGYTMASTVGRGNYFTDPETGTILYTDVYDWNPTKEKDFKGDNMYQNIRNSFRQNEDKNLTKEKNDKFRIGFKLNPQEMEELRKKKAADKESDSQLGSRMLEAGMMRRGGQLPSEKPSIYPKKVTAKPVGYAKDPVKDDIGPYIADLALQTGLDQSGVGSRINLSRTLVESTQGGSKTANVAKTLLEVFGKPLAPIVGDLGINVAQDLIDLYDGDKSGKPFKVQPQSGPIVENTGIKQPLLKRASGGSLLDNFKRTSSSTAEIHGPSHENGGVPVPGMNAEVEGGETLAGDYVFSDELGFAKLHKPIALAKGKIEKKPATRERLNTLKLLNEKENNLKLMQEYVKSKNNLQ